MLAISQDIMYGLPIVSPTAELKVIVHAIKQIPQRQPQVRSCFSRPHER